MTAAATEVAALRREVEGLGPRNPARRFPPELRDRLARCAQNLRSAGAPVSEVAQGLGVPWESLSRWIGEVRSGAFRQVSIRSAAPAIARPELVLRTRAFTVEGMDVASLADLLRHLE